MREYSSEALRSAERRVGVLKNRSSIWRWKERARVRMRHTAYVANYPLRLWSRRYQHTDVELSFVLSLGRQELHPKMMLFKLATWLFIRGKKVASFTHFHAHVSDFVFVMTDRWATCEIEASASPLKPYVAMRLKSEKVDNLEVVKRSARIGKSAFRYLAPADPLLSTHEQTQALHEYQSHYPGFARVSCHHL